MVETKQSLTHTWKQSTHFWQTRSNRGQAQLSLYIITSMALSCLLFTAPNSHAETAPGTTINEPTNPAASGYSQATTARDKALNANAPAFADKAWRRADKVWLKLLNARTKGKEPAADDLANEAIALFSAAELEAIQAVQLADANAAIDSAQRNKASRYAPLTLEQARKLVVAAEQVLAADRQDLQAAAKIAAQATATARHAQQIAAIAAKKPTSEEIILQWEGYLKQLQTAAAIASDIDTDTNVAIAELAAEIERARRNEVQLRQDLEDNRAFRAALEEEIRDLDKQLGGASGEKQLLMLQLEEQARAREQFAQAEGLFGPDEAIVFRQSADIVVRAIGLKFASGSPNLDPGNAALLEKIATVIAIYPRSLITVEGHTDSRGSDRINKRLSENRAQTVAEYVINELKIPRQRVTAAGYGAERPIANNETEAGRAKNRRIDLLITPINGPAF